MTTVTEAQRLWQAARAASRCPELTAPERVAVSEASGRVTAEPVLAVASSPPWDASAMDGVALSAHDTVGASRTSPKCLGEDAYVVVDTGDPIPEGFDAVVMREDLELGDGFVRLFHEVSRYENVRLTGEDIVAGQRLVPTGQRLGPAEVAVCAAGGLSELTVRARPRVAILPTGDEIRPAGSTLGPGQFYDTNSIMLAARARELGCEGVVLDLEPDVPARIAAAALQASRTCDLLVIIAGASAGRDDYTARVIDELGTLAVKGVAIRPGHPVMLGTIAAMPVLGAPGYPVSAALSFEVFAAPLLARLQGWRPSAPLSSVARLVQSVSSPADKEEWLLVRVAKVRGQLVCEPAARGAGALTSLAGADGLVRLPREVAGVDAGTEVNVQLLVPPDRIETRILVAARDEPALELAAARLSPRRALTTSPLGMPESLRRLAEGSCHVVGSSLFDPVRGTCEVDLAAKFAAPMRPAIFHLARREVGLIVAPGNPLGLKTIEDLDRPGLRYGEAKEGPDIGDRPDREPALAGRHPMGLAGNIRRERSDLAVAASIAAGRCDCALGVRATAAASELGFVALRDEPYYLLMAPDTCDDALLAPLLDLLSDESYRDAIAALGYDTSQMGERIA